MIILFSYEGDKNTNYIIEWLNYYNCPFKRIELNNEDFRNIEIEFSDMQTNIKFKLKTGEIINFSECSYFFVRGTGFKRPNIKNTSDLPNFIFNKYILNEYEALTNYFYSEINRKAIGCFYNNTHLKLIQLRIAKEIGLAICDTLITNNKRVLVNHFKYRDVITKAIEDNIGLEYRNRLIVQRVQKVRFNSIESHFFPSLFQSEISKEFEIRVFYLNKKTYSISFASESDIIDMRDNYKINEYNKFKLPNEIEKKVIKLMTILQLNSGSLDFIKSKDGQYYFLEVNLNGQYDWVSHYGGYNLHQKIAHFLTLKAKEYECPKASTLSHLL